MENVSEHVWTSQDIGLNSIAGILKDNNSLFLKGLENISLNPMNVSSVNIKKVRLNEFEPYFTTIHDEYDKYLLNRVVGVAAASEGFPDLYIPLANTNDSGDSFNSLEEWTARLAMAGSFVANQLPPLRQTSPLKKDKRLNSNKAHIGNAPPLHSIPGIFFDENFSLANPHTFSAVCEYLDITGTNSDSFTTQKILQEKLSHYLDVVEIHLIKEISAKSDSFFSALKNLQVLNSETRACIQRITELQKKLEVLSKNHIRKGLEIVKIKRERGNYELLLEAVKLVYKIKQTQPMIQVLLNKGDFVGALDLMEYSGCALNGFEGKNAMPSPVSISEASHGSKTLGDGVVRHTISSLISKKVDLKGVKSLGNLPIQLAEIFRTIYSVMEADFLNILSNDLSKVMATPLSISSTLDKTKALISPLLINAPINQWVNKILEGDSKYFENQVSLNLPDENLLAVESVLTDKLQPVVFGLIRMNKLPEALNAYKNKLLQDIKILSKKHYPADFYVPNDLTDVKDKQSKLAKHLKGMAFHKFFDLLQMVYITSLHILQRVAIYHAIISRLIIDAHKQSLVVGLESIATSNKRSPISPPKNSPGKLSPPNSRSKAEEDDDLGDGGLDLKSIEDSQWASKHDPGADGTAFEPFIIDSATVLASACDLAHVRCAKLLGSRSDQHAMLNPNDFYRFYATTWNFINAAESITGRICFGLKGNILSQAKSFLNIFHEERSKQITIMIENEQWSHVEVPVDFQNMINTLIQRVDDEDMEDDDHRINLLKRHNSDKSINEGSNLTLDSLKRPNKGDTMKSKDFLMIKRQYYFVVGFMLLFIKAMNDYINVAKNVPSISTDVLHRLLELLKMVNSKTCQMILGAGAIKSAGLKNITAKHIAYASQSLGVIIAIIPELKSVFNDFLPRKQGFLLEEFEKMINDYIGHQSQLHAKLVSIMQDRVLFYSAKLCTIKWDDPDPKDCTTDNPISPHMSGLVKETTNLYKVIFKYLPLKTVQKIMSEIFLFYDARFEQDFVKINLFTSIGKSRLLNQVRFYLDNLCNLPEIDGPCNQLEIVINNLKIKDPLSVRSDQGPEPTLITQQSSNSKRPFFKRF